LHEQLLDGRSEEEFVRFLLLHNQGAVSIPDDDGWLPLHFACMWRPLSIVKLVYDACPMALHRQNDGGRTPLDIARCQNKEEVVAFLEALLELERQAREISQPDGNGQLPIQRVLRSSEAQAYGCCQS
jgi:ankyrin repeat protein